MWLLLLVAPSAVLAFFGSPILHAGCWSAQPAFGPSSNFSSPVSADGAQLVQQTRNGKLLNIVLPNAAWPNAQQNVSLVHLWGSPFEQGFAQGQLLPVRKFIDDTWAYLEGQVEQILKSVPKWLAKMIADVGLDAALDATELATRAFTPNAFYETLDGLAAGSGANRARLIRVHMLAGLTQGKCSFAGIWGPALDPAAGTAALMLRALDWDMDGPFRDQACVMVFHSRRPADGNSFVTIGFPGFMGAMSGMNEHLLAISEIGVSYPDASFGSESRVGVPFIFMLREILQYDATLAAAQRRMESKRRTCDLLIGVGDGKTGEIRGFQYSHSVLRAYSDTNLLPVNSTWHPVIPSIVYNGMDYLCPTYNAIMAAQLRKYYGHITPLVARQHISAVEMSGSNHVVWYDLTHGVMWAAFAAPRTAGGLKEAYFREYLELNVTKLLAVKQ